MSLRGGFFDRREKNPVARYEAKQSVVVQQPVSLLINAVVVELKGLLRHMILPSVESCSSQ